MHGLCLLPYKWGVSAASASLRPSLPLLPCFYNFSQLLQAAGITASTRFLSEFIFPCRRSYRGRRPSPSRAQPGFLSYHVGESRYLSGQKTQLDWGALKDWAVHMPKTCLRGGGGVNTKASVLGFNPFKRRLSVTTHRQGWSRACV